MFDNLNTCERCGNVSQADRCRCSRHLVSVPLWDGSDSREMYAILPEDAAVRYVEECDSADLEVLDTPVVCLVTDATGSIHSFKVRAEAVVDYYVEEEGDDE